MATPPISVAEKKRREDVIHQCLEEGYSPIGVSGGRGSAAQEAARRLGLSSGSFTGHLRSGKLDIDWSRYKPPAPAASAAPPRIEIPAAADPAALDRVIASLRKHPMSLAEIAAAAQVSNGQALDALEAATARGVNVQRRGDLWAVDKDQAPSFTTGAVFEYVSRPDNTFYFGATSDNHLGSKYERRDVLDDLYDRFAAAGVDRVFNAGNWIDGEARFNKFDLHTHGMDAQLRYLADVYPKRHGIETYAVAGDDHEGWYGQREGVDIGRYAENSFRAAGRTDWHNLGYMEAHIRLVNANSGKSSTLAVVHPGGGSAYALSYSIQKIIESLEGGEKPAVGLYGHYHKLWAGNIRNVWVVQTGTTEDQTPFMRKKRLEAHVGGAMVWLEQDPRTGAIISMAPQLIRYFNKGYYVNDRWSHSGDVTLPERRAS